MTNLTLPFCQSAFEWVWKTSIWAGMLTVCVVLVQSLLGKRLGPRLHYALSLLVLVRLLMPALPVSSISLQKIIPHRAEIVRPIAIAYYYADPPRPAAAATHNEVSNLTLAPVTPQPVMTLACGLWLCGVSLLALLAACRYRQWSRRLAKAEIISDPRLLEMLEQARNEMGVRRRVVALSLANAPGPAVFGIINVRLIMPENILRRLSDEELRMVLLHEMAHVRRHDAAFNTLLMSVQFLHWFNPLVWLALRRIRADRETICDGMVMRKTGASQRTSYGRLLLRLIEQFPAGQRFLPSNAAMVGSKNEIKRRILMIKNHGQKHLVGGFVAIVAIGLLGCAGFTRAENPASSSPQPAPATRAPSTPLASSQQVQSGDSAPFIVQATGTAPLSYQWYSNGTNATSATVTTSAVSANGTPLTYQWQFNGTPIAASTASLADQLIGTWVLEKELGPQSQPSGVGKRWKNFTGTHWNITQFDPKNGVTIFFHGGTYKLDGNKYFEKVEFANENTKGAIGHTGEFIIKIEGDKLTQTGINNPWNEIWKRVK